MGCQSVSAHSWGGTAFVLNENTQFRPPTGPVARRSCGNRFHPKAATSARGTEGQDLQHRLGSSRLVRLLQEWAQVDGELARHDVAERLGHWLSAFDAVKLDGALQTIASYPSQTKLRGQAVDAGAVARQVNQVKADLTALITAKVTPERPTLPAAPRTLLHTLEEDDARTESKYAPHYQRYLGLQKQMETAVGALRAQVRQMLSKGSPALRQLVALDAVMEQMLGPREQKLWASVPVYLERRLEHWRQHHQQAITGQGGDDDPIRWRQAGGWIAAFEHDMRDMMLAELQQRLQPVVGLMEAAQNATDGPSPQAAPLEQTEHSENSESQ